MSFNVKRVIASPLAIVRAQQSMMFSIIQDKRLSHEQRNSRTGTTRARLATGRS